MKFTGLLLVLPDEHLDEPAASLGSSRGAEQVVLRASVLLTALRDGLPDSRPVGGNEIFAASTLAQTGGSARPSAQAHSGSPRPVCSSG